MFYLRCLNTSPYCPLPQDMGWTVDQPWRYLSCWTTLSMRSDELLTPHIILLITSSPCLCALGILKSHLSYTPFLLIPSLLPGCHLVSSPTISTSLWQNGEPKHSSYNNTAHYYLRTFYCQHSDRIPSWFTMIVWWLCVDSPHLVNYCIHEAWPRAIWNKLRFKGHFLTSRESLYIR